uniref:Uncharacterized protein n=1 Tax=Meloidogyne incognita TaxID=6306 RepID=A0A914LTB8_MELIC
MFFCFDDGSGTKKASTATLSSATTILPMFFASTLFVFVLVGQVNSEEEDNVTVGFFNHTLKNDQVTLRDYSAAVEAGDVYNLTKYTSLPGSCDVEIKNGSIVLYYRRKNTNIKNDGCTVDLLTNHSNIINFRTGVKIKPGDCLKNCSMQEFPFDGASDNTLPFAYSSAENKDITKFKTRRPSEGRKENCSKFEACGNNEQLCMEWTSLEIAWNKCIWSGDYHIFAHIHPIGEKLVQWNIKDLNGSEKFGLTIEEGGFSMDLKGEKKEEGKYNLTDQKRQHPYCVPKGEGFVKPSKWEIIGKNPVPEHGHLLVFYMLPQSASRKHIDGKVKVDPPDGPDCEELYIEFDMQNYTLLFVGDPPPTTTTTTTTTTPPPTTTTTTTSTTATSTPAAVKTTERTTTTTKKPKHRSDDFWFAVFCSGIFAGLMFLCFGAIIFFCWVEKITRFWSKTYLRIHIINITIFAFIGLGVFFFYTTVDDPSATIVFFLIPSLACCCIVSTSCIIHGHYKVAKLDYDFDKREAKKEKKEAELQKKIDYVNSIDAVVNDYVASITEEDDTNLLLRKAWYKKAKPLGPREYGPAPYSSVGFSTDSYSHIETTTAVEGDRKKDTTKANSLMAATETSKMEAAEHSKMGGKSEEAKAKVEEKSKMGEKSKMATTANSMMETNSKMEEEGKSKSSQQE